MPFIAQEVRDLYRFLFSKLYVNFRSDVIRFILLTALYPLSLSLSFLSVHSIQLVHELGNSVLVQLVSMVQYVSAQIWSRS